MGLLLSLIGLTSAGVVVSNKDTLVGWPLLVLGGEGDREEGGGLVVSNKDTLEES